MTQQLVCRIIISNLGGKLLVDEHIKFDLPGELLLTSTPYSKCFGWMLKNVLNAKIDFTSYRSTFPLIKKLINAGLRPEDLE